ncbi:hypothetical protein evm_012303 [Chilo suppressalis]|nr:hypothetical protein evm_012303 [Chilo suppressalis]
MNILPILLFLLHLSDVFPQNPGYKDHKKEPILPKKNMQILISRKFSNGKLPLVKTKKPVKNEGYTVFPAVASMEKKLYHVPPSPYFPLDPYESQKTRVKKVLSDYVMTAIRKKRSADAVTVQPQKEIKKQDIAAIRKEKTKEKRKGDGKNAKSKRDKKNKTYKELSIIKYYANGSVYTVMTRQTLTPKHVKQRLNNSRAKKNKKRHSHLTLIKKHANGSTYTVKASHPLVSDRIHPKDSRIKSLKWKKANKRRLRSNKRRSRSHNVTESKHATVRAKAGRRLIAARDAMIEDYPYVVSIQKNSEHWCAGALLNPVLVITTANCVWKSNRMSRLQVRAGSRHTDRGGVVVGIQEVMKHPGWSIRRDPDNDVALLLLDERIKFSDKIHGIDLPNRIMMPPFEDAWVTSWGAERRDGVFDKKSMTLQLYHARLMDRSNCNNVTQRFGIAVTENFICLSQTGRRAPCTRDTGAPAVSDGILWGLASWGIRKLCGTERFPAMFSYLGSQTNMDFIANATHYLMSDERFYPYLDRYPTRAYSPTTTTTEVVLYIHV